MRLHSSLAIVMFTTLWACSDNGAPGNQNVNQNGNAQALCGNGQLEGSEDCDDGEQNSDTQPDACRTDCSAAHCGDSVVDNGEQCDEGPANNDSVPDACRSDCTPPLCGDLVVDVGRGEQCDDGGTDEGDGCSPTCLVELCGNGELDPEEECDDGNTARGDGCGQTCLFEECGNTVLDPGEQCDDGGIEPGDTCGPTCLVEVCGNAYLDPGEQCDTGDASPGDGCGPTCLFEVCGNGFVDALAGEQCDDGNLRSHDGCSSGCTVESPIWTKWEHPLFPRRYVSMAYDSQRQRVLLWGGTYPGMANYPELWAHDGTAWTEIRTPTIPPFSTSPVAYDRQRDRLVTVGGNPLETWEFDGTDWSRVITAHSPPWRYLFPLAYDAERQRTVLCGGTTSFSSGYKKDTWTYDGVDWTQGADLPASGRAYSAMAWDPVRKVVYLFGGYYRDPTTHAYFASLYEWNGSAWAPRPSLTVAYSARMSHALTYDVSQSRLVLFGGWSDTRDDNDLNVFNGTAWQQIHANDAPGSPSKRNQHALAYDEARGHTLLFGGGETLSGGIGLFNDTWTLTTSTWTELDTYSDSRPPVRSSAAIAYDTTRGVAVVFGGYDGVTPVLGDTWEFDGRAWQERHPASSPPARDAHAMTFDADLEVTVLFGGWTGAAALNDTWTYNGSDWSPGPVAPAGLTARYYSALAYDRMRHRTVLFGGQTGAGYLNDTWEFDGATWSQVVTDPAHTPAARAGLAMTYDPGRGRVVMHGGGSGTYSYIGDFWEFDGMGWNQIAGVAPLARRNHQLAYDPNLEQLLIVCGTNGSGVFTDQVYEWDGLSWDLVYTPYSIVRRSYLSAVWHDAARKLLAFGGDPFSPGGNDYDNDTWLYHRQSAWPEETCDSAADTDLDGLAGCEDPDCEGLPCGQGMMCEAGVCL